MKKIVLATGNRDKLFEIKNIWRGIDKEISWLGDYPEVKPALETGRTLKENALLKASAVSSQLKETAVSDDTGLFVDYLNGDPGVFSSRFAGEEASYSDNVEKLLRELKGVSSEKRKARFICLVCLISPGKDPVFTEGVLEGVITSEPRGINGFGYDPVFEIESGRTLAEIDPAEKNAISHRYLAFKKMADIITSGKIL